MPSGAENIEEEIEKPRAIKWLDQLPNMSEEAKLKGLVSNKSNEDLVHKMEEDLTPIDTHKHAVKTKCAIKPFKIDINKLTGLKNFSELSPDPLALPHYAP